MRASFRLDGIVTVVDAKHIWQHLDDSPEAEKQLAFADVLMLNKTDLVPPAESTRSRPYPEDQRGRENPSRPKTPRSILEVRPRCRRLQSLGRATELDPEFLEPEYPFEWAGAYPLPAGTHELVIGHDQ